MGKAILVFRVEAHQRHHRADLFVPLLARPETMDLQAFADDLAHHHPRVEGSVRVLENHLHPPREDARLGLGEVGCILAFEDHLAAGRPIDAYERPSEGGLPAAGLTDQTKGLAAVDGKIDAVHCLGRHPASKREVHPELAELDLRDHAVALRSPMNVSRCRAAAS